MTKKTPVSSELLYYRAMSECSSNCLTYVFCRIPAQGIWHRICAARLYNTRRSAVHPLRTRESIRPGKVRRHYILGFCLYKFLINNTSYKYHKSPVGVAPSSSLLSLSSLSILFLSLSLYFPLLFFPSPPPPLPFAPPPSLFRYLSLTCFSLSHSTPFFLSSIFSHLCQVYFIQEIFFFFGIHKVVFFFMQSCCITVYALRFHKLLNNF